MPAIRNEFISDRRRGPRSTDPIACPICDKILNRRPDLNRHMLTHNLQAERYTCDKEGCIYSTLQRSNFNTHMRTHTGEKRHLCEDDPETCSFRTADPAALTRHRKRLHGYVPRTRKSMKAAAPSASSTLATAATATPAAVAGPSSPAGPSSTATVALSTHTHSSASTSEGHSYSSGAYDASSAYSSGSSSPSSVRSEEFYPSPLGSSASSSSSSSSSASSRESSAAIPDFEEFFLTPDSSGPGPCQLFLPTVKEEEACKKADERFFYPETWNLIPETATWDFVENGEPCDWAFEDSTDMLDDVVRYSPMPLVVWDPAMGGMEWAVAVSA